MLSSYLIFSEKRSTRIKRHLLFWLVWWIYFGLLHAVLPFGKEEISYFRNLPFTLTESVLHLIPQILFTYPILYFVLPRFVFVNKYAQGFLWALALMLLTAVINLLMIQHLNPKILDFLLPDRFLVNTQRPPSVSFAMGVIGSLKGTLTCTAVATAFRLVKHWYLKEQRNLQLQKENTEAQLQLLTAQVHPHFLFNTLNNIYSKTQTESPGGARMIIELSHILRYVLDEGKNHVVPLENELQMLRDYIHLEKLRYDDKLDLHTSFPAQTEEIYIAPLLLLPFVENCFKHGTSKMLNNPWINLKIELDDNLLFMKLMNGKKNSQVNNLRKGTGIENVRRRLDLLCKDKYELQIIDDEEVFVINLKLELIRTNPSITVHPQKETYA